MTTPATNHIVSVQHDGQDVMIPITIRGDAVEICGQITRQPVNTERRKRSGKLRDAWTWARAEASHALHGDTPQAVQGFRATCCTGSGITAPCPHYRDGYCKACGCPEWSAARMERKWRIPAAPCPTGRFSEWPIRATASWSRDTAPQSAAIAHATAETRRAKT